MSSRQKVTSLHALAVSLFLAAVCERVEAGPVTLLLPGYSFEAPTTDYAQLIISWWQKTPKPATYNESGAFRWSQLTGVFKNTAPGEFDHLDNCEGNQAAWIFVVPQAGFFQDYDCTDFTHTTPLHAFTATYEVGQMYDFTVGLNGGGGGMLDGATIELSFYYRDANGVQQQIAATTVTNSAALFPNHTHLTDFTLHLRTVTAGDPWAGRHIGVQLLSTVTAALQGGYWDVDNVRIVATPFVITPAPLGANTWIGWPSASGYNYQVERSTDFATWTPYEGTLAGTGGELSKVLPPTSTAGAFFRVKESAAP